MLVGGLLETVSVTVILPFMQVVLNPSQVMEKPFVKVACRFLGIESDRTFLVFLALLIAAMYIFKNLFLILEYNVQYRFVYNNKFALQQRLLHTIINRPYQYFLKATSGEIMRLVHGDVEAAFDVLVNLLNLFTELIVSFMLITTILIVSPVITLCIAGVLFILVAAIYLFVRPRQTEAGKTAQRAETGKNKWLLQSVQGIKEIKVNSKEKFFEKQYAHFGLLANVSRRKSQILTMMPRYFIEAVSMASMFIAVAVFLYFGADFEVIVPTLTVVAMAAIRILPSTNRISYTMSNISFQMTYFNTFMDNINDIDGKGGRLTTEGETKIAGEHVVMPHMKEQIEFKNIEFAYSADSDAVLKKANMTIRKGESVGIIGESGAGKTTAVDIILGLLVPQSGDILIDGVDIRSDMHGWLSQVGYIPQMIFMMDGSIRENILFGEEETQDSDDKVWDALREASLDEFVHSLPKGLDTRIGERGVRLSGGQRQRIGIARALYRNPEILIFDEATSALDNDTEASIMESINNLYGQKTMIIIAHRLTTIENCDHVFRVENKQIVRDR